MEINRVYSSFGELATEICVSKVKFNFENFQQESKIVSQKISVPEMVAIWWIELRPYGNCKTFAQTSAPPAMKIVFEFHDPQICSPQLFHAMINVTATNVEKYGMIFKDYKRSINAEQIEIDTISSEYKSSSSRNNSSNAYYHHFNYGSADIWKSLTLLSLDCSVVINYLGDSECNFSERVERLPKINVLNRQKIASSFDDETFSDFTFFVKEKSFKVHKILLSFASDVFKTMFTCGLDETKKNTANVDCDPEIFGHFLKFIYTGDLPLQQLPTISFELYELAHLYNVEELKKGCLRFILGTKITIDNALKLYEFATTYDIAQLLGTSWEFIKIKMLKIFDECEPKPVKKVIEMLEEKNIFEDHKKTFIGKKRASENDEQNVSEKEIGKQKKRKKRAKKL